MKKEGLPCNLIDRIKKDSVFLKPIWIKLDSCVNLKPIIRMSSIQVEKFLASESDTVLDKYKDNMT